MGANLRYSAKQRASRVGGHHDKTHASAAGDNTRSHKDSLGERVVNGTEMQQWQYEVTAGGRIWYCIDNSSRTVWMTAAHTGHPKATE